MGKTITTIAGFVLALVAVVAPMTVHADEPGFFGKMFDSLKDPEASIQKGVDSTATSVLGAAPGARILISTGFLDKRKKIPVACYNDRDTPVLTGDANPLGNALALATSCKELQARGLVTPVAGAATAAGSNAGNSNMPADADAAESRRAFQEIRNCTIYVVADDGTDNRICENTDTHSKNWGRPSHRLNSKFERIPLKPGDDPFEAQMKKMRDQLNAVPQEQPPAK